MNKLGKALGQRVELFFRALLPKVTSKICITFGVTPLEGFATLDKRSQQQ
jgi:hypothetical protein